MGQKAPPGCLLYVDLPEDLGYVIVDDRGYSVVEDTDTYHNSPPGPDTAREMVRRWNMVAQLEAAGVFTPASGALPAPPVTGSITAYFPGIVAYFPSSVLAQLVENIDGRWFTTRNAGEDVTELLQPTAIAAEPAAPVYSNGAFSAGPPGKITLHKRPAEDKD